MCSWGPASSSATSEKRSGPARAFELPTGDTVEPDASFVTAARWKAAPQPERGKFLRVVPDLVAEILSTATASHDRGEKKAIYERAGVREYWLIDERARELVVFNLDGERYGRERVFAPGKPARSEVLGMLRFDAAELFP
jgi:Uma2 family endonuclease